MPLRDGRLVGEVAATVPAAIAAFRLAGVDCCRDARLSLEEASLRTGVRCDRLISLLRGAPTKPAAIPNWRECPLRDLTRHIVETLHPAAIAAMETLSSQLAAVAHASPNDWTIANLRSAFAEVANNLVIHVWRVENEVFPLLDRLEEEHAGSAPPLTREELPNPHDPMLEGLRRLRSVTQDYSLREPPAIGALIGGMHAFDDTLHRHIHLEHHVLYPRASALCACPLSDSEPSGVLTWV